MENFNDLDVDCYRKQRKKKPKVYFHAGPRDEVRNKTNL